MIKRNVEEPKVASLRMKRSKIKHQYACLQFSKKNQEMSFLLCLLLTACLWVNPVHTFTLLPSPCPYTRSILHRKALGVLKSREWDDDFNDSGRIPKQRQSQSPPSQYSNSPRRQYQTKTFEDESSSWENVRYEQPDQVAELKKTSNERYGEKKKARDDDYYYYYEDEYDENEGYDDDDDDDYYYYYEDQDDEKDLRDGNYWINRSGKGVDRNLAYSSKGQTRNRKERDYENDDEYYDMPRPARRSRR